MRKRVIECVLATDMSSHSKIIGILTARICLHLSSSTGVLSFSELLNENQPEMKFELQQDYLNTILHAVDIGHAAKPFELEVKWAELVTQEFHNQGDIEKSKNLAVSFLCERSTCNLPCSQIAFITGIVLPTFQLVQKVLPETSIYVEYIENSKVKWQELIIESRVTGSCFHGDLNTGKKTKEANEKRKCFIYE